MTRKLKRTRAPGAGRPPINGERGERFQVHLPPTIEAALRALGDGSLSQGIVRAAQRANVA